jgi:hypothetical protein
MSATLGCPVDEERGRAAVCAQVRRGLATKTDRVCRTMQPPLLLNADWSGGRSKSAVSED